MSSLPFSKIEIECRGKIAIVTLNRPERRNALDIASIGEIERFFATPPKGVCAIVLAAQGDHFCAGLDLAEHYELDRSPVEFMRMCQNWHSAFDKMQFGGLPVVAALKGAVVGGGLELAAATHVRVADETTFFALPEGQRGIFTGGGATVRVGRIITPARMVDMMLSARSFDAKRGFDLGLAHEVVPKGESLTRAIALAEQMAEHSPLSNYAIVTAIARINDMSTTDGLFAESLMAGMVQTNPELRERLAAFLAKKTPRIEPNSG